MAEKNKIKILCFMDSPAVATGFGTVARGIFKNLAETGRYDIDVFGINDLGGWKDPEEHPYRIYPAMLPGDGDFYGRGRFINVLRGADRQIRPSWDIIFCLNDPFIFEQPLPLLGKSVGAVMSDIHKLYRETTEPKNWWKSVFYIPVDSDIKGNWIENGIAHADYLVAYTEYGREEINKSNQRSPNPIDLSDMRIIYHGVDTNIFKPISDNKKKDFKKRFFKGDVDENAFVVTCVARNQMRKDLPRTMKIFREFQKRRPNSFLYLHSREKDVWGSLLEYARSFQLEPGKDWAFPNNFNENVGYPIEALNLIYNMSDAHILNSVGEGFGLPILEAMASKVVNLAPNITSIPEIFNTQNNDIEDPKNIPDINDIRGIPLKSGSTSSEWTTFGPVDFERVRPLTNVDDAVNKLLWVYDNPGEVNKIVERAYKWVQDYTWKKIADQWDKLFQEVYKDLEIERKKPLPKKNIKNKDEVDKDSDQSDKTKLVESESDVARSI